MAKIPTFKSKKTTALTPERGHTQKIPTIPYGESLYDDPDFPGQNDGEETAADAFFRNQAFEDQTQQTQSEVAQPTQNASESEAYARLKAQRAERKRKTIIKRSIIAAVIVAVLGGCVAWYFMMNEQNEAVEQPYVTDSVIVGDYSNDINASGSVKPVSSVIVTPEIEGIVDTVKVSEGDTVKKGDVLFTIKNDQLDRDIRLKEREAYKAQRALDQAYRALNDAIAAQQAGVEVEPNENDVQGENTSDSLNNGVESAQWDLEDAQLNLEDANNALEEAKAHADARTVTSPINGTLISFKVIKGSSLEEGSESGQPLVQIANVSKMKVSVQVGEVDITKLKVGQEGIATFAAIPDISLKAKIKTIASASTSTSANGDYDNGGNATYTVELVIDEPDERLKSGMTADIVISTDVRKNVIMVSPAALRTDDGQSYYVIRETDPETHQGVRVNVDVIAENGISAAVAGDLVEGDVLIISGEGELLDEAEDPGREPNLDDMLTDAGINDSAINPDLGADDGILYDDMAANPADDASSTAR